VEREGFNRNVLMLRKITTILIRERRAYTLKNSKKRKGIPNSAKRKQAKTDIDPNPNKVTRMGMGKDPT